MIVNLIKSTQMFSLTLPNKVKGQYWLRDNDSQGNLRDLTSIEAIDGRWILKSSKLVSVLNEYSQPVKNTVLRSQSFFKLKLNGVDEPVMLFAESVDASRYTFRKVLARKNDVFAIGRTNDNNFCYENKFVSARHAKISYNGSKWTVTDLESTNGTFVNGYKISSCVLSPGDFIYIMGLKIIVGSNFLAVNNPDGLLKIHAKSLSEYVPQRAEEITELAEIPEKKYFYRSPRFHREIVHAEIKIDPPPQIQKQDTVPLALMLGPSITMGIASLSTAMISLNSVLMNNGDFIQALPSLIMAASMLIGTVLWPILTKKHEKKEKIKYEKRRHQKYLAYLDSIRDEIRRKSKEQSDILNENLISLEECADIIAREKPNLWERALGQPDFLRLRLGIGCLPLDADVKFPEKRFSMDDDTLQDAMYSLGTEPKQLVNVPISISLVDNMVLGIYGSSAMNVDIVKSLILRMISLHSYDELKIILMCDESDKAEWSLARVIPHFWDNDKTIRFLAVNADEVKEISAFIEKNILSRADVQNHGDSEISPYYVIISASKTLSEKCDALQQLIKYKNNRGFSVIFSAPELKDLPKESKTIIFANGKDSQMFDRESTMGSAVKFSMDEVKNIAIDSLSRVAANIELDLTTQRYALPSALTFLEMFNVGKIEHLNVLTRWKENNPTISLQTPVGVDSYGSLFGLDLHEKFHGPHGLIAGMTGSGKSEFIITYILSLAVNYHPDEVAFILIDYKGGGLAGAFEDAERGIKLPHLAGTITNLDGAAVKRSLISIQSELRRRQKIFNEARKISNEGTMDIYKYQQLYRDRAVSEPIPHLFIISDEFAELKAQQPEFMEQLISAARIGRSLGVHLILATQKPNGVVDDQIWSNSKFRVCLKVQDKADSMDMIKRPDAAEISQTGRFYLQVGFNELFALGQSAWCGAEYVPTETVEKTVDGSIRVVDNLGRTLTKVSPAKKKTYGGKKVKQIVAVVKYLSELAAEENIRVRSLWLDPIPELIYVDDIERKYMAENRGTFLNPVVGEYDDPFNQKQGVLTVPFSSEGNCLIYGSTGSGKTTFLTTLCYSLIKNHTADEVNIYIMDFGSETLRAFEKAPQVGGVIVSADEEKTVNFLKMLFREIETRKSLFSKFGGDYAGYCRNSGKTVPNIVVLLNNYSGFVEQYERLQEQLTLLTREGVKYGIYFAVTAGSTSAVRFKMQQNFKIMLTMQLNDVTDYPVIVGKTEGLIPSKYKGRGLVALDRVYEFQTARCCKVGDGVQDSLRLYCLKLRSGAAKFARPIPVLPNTVDFECVKDAIEGIKKIPVGINKKTLATACVNLADTVVYPAAAQELYETADFTKELVRILTHCVKTYVVDMEHLYSDDLEVSFISDKPEELVQSLFLEMVNRNNTYKDSKLQLSSLEKFEERVYVLIGFKKLYERLSNEGREKLGLLLEKAESIYKLHFVIIEAAAQFKEFAYEPWYKKQLSGSDGLWIGDGVADQYMFKLNKITSELYDEIGLEFGYVVSKGKLSLVKLVASDSGEAE